jgi:hypothetical protein
MDRIACDSGQYVTLVGDIGAEVLAKYISATDTMHIVDVATGNIRKDREYFLMSEDGGYLMAAKVKAVSVERRQYWDKCHMKQTGPARPFHNRNYNRFPISIAVEITKENTQSVEGRTLNISYEGIALTAQKDFLVIGDEVAVCSDTNDFGTVKIKWVSKMDGQAGGAFTEILDKGFVDRLIQEYQGRC